MIERPKLFPVLGFPHPYRTVRAPAGNHTAIETEGYAYNAPVMSGEGQLVRSRIDVPQPDGPIRAATGQHNAIKTKRETRDAVRMSVKGARVRAKVGIPQPNGPIRTPAGQEVVIHGTEGRAQDSGGMPGERRFEFPGAGDPQIQQSILRSTGQHTAVDGAIRQAQYRRHVSQRQRDPAGQNVP